ncbi:MAG: UPF0261 family protein [Flexistipes sinusarabici]|uniref:UPF0261 protein FXF49_06715 n=1 Tax=Flexistipes sinusarabici TaxID=2352 RepID=A0A5D0MLT9_FLESI|nr:Tm-1-like ATP-binding domain-containing protein [Flexistipes sinusarabici]TYB33362.1 MAG: UPF0261 family protein [Flexistipes sinusarabici]
MSSIYVIGTCDTKYDELKFVKDTVETSGVPALLVDVGIKAHGNEVDITNKEVSACHSFDKDFLSRVEDRGEAVSLMAEALQEFLKQREDVAGVVGLGGSGGTSIVTAGMRVLDIGIPKVMVSTVASGNVAPYVGPNDICMMYSVTDVAGLNRISKKVLSNAANAVAGMVSFKKDKVDSEKPAIGMTMFGVTTPCVDAVRKQLEKDYDCLVFHATGTGGQSMEKLLDSGMLSGVIDISTTEICDLHMGGVMNAGEDRLGAVIRTKKPYVGSTGALDMVNFGAKETVPEKYKDRNLHVHNPQVTLMRTTPEENRRMGKWIAEKLNKCEGEVRFLIPEKGVSMIDAPGMPFYDPEADKALFDAIEDNFNQTDSRRLLKLPYHINDKGFADELVKNFLEIINN